MFSRNIRCNHCGKSGQIKAHDTIERFADENLFKPIGKTGNGYMVFKCPECQEKVVKSPYSFIFTAKIKLAIAIVIIIAVWYLVSK